MSSDERLGKIRIERSSRKYAKSFNNAVDLVARERLYLATVEGFPPESSEGFVAYMEDADLPQYFAILDDEVIGWCDITPKSIPEFAHVGVLGMGVIQGYRGRGLGRSLLEKTLLHAKEISGLGKVELTVFKSNESAIKLYESFGFVLEGERKNSRKIDGRYDSEVLMGKFLSPSWDDDLIRFDAEGAALLPTATDQGYAENAGARIWYAAYGTGAPVILLHGGYGNAGNWGYQVPALVDSGYRPVLIDSRGHGRSTRDSRPYSYELMATDVLAVMDALGLEKAALVGWSDGACTALILADKEPSRVTGVFYFACNMDAHGVKETIENAPTLEHCMSRHIKDYARLSATPEKFDEFRDAVFLMQRTQPNYSAGDLARISVPVTVAQSERDEFIKFEHAEYLARTIRGARLVRLHDVTHFAPLQRPEVFNRAVLDFLTSLNDLPREGEGRTF